MAAHPEIRPQTIRIETATSAHCHVFEALHQLSFDKPWTAVEFEQIMNQPGTCAFVAVTAQITPLGFIVVRSVVDEAEILTLCVDPQHRGCKIATRMVGSAITSCKTRGINRIFLEVAEDNHTAIRLYQRCGFTAVGERPAYYRKRGLAPVKAIIMACSYG